MSQVPLYDAFSRDYDRFVGWEGRLAYEMPFIETQLRAVGAGRVLDTACGTGQHALALARRGYRVVGADLSPGMIQKARENAAAVDDEVRFVAAGFGQLAERVIGQFDALLCLGNSLPHALTPQALDEALRDFAAVLRPGGLVLIQNRNFDLVVAQKQRWMPPQSHREGEIEWLFVRFYDFEPDGRLSFNVATLVRDDPDQAWRQRATATQLQPWRQAELSQALGAAGFGDVRLWGDMQGSPFALESSPNLIIGASTRPPRV